MLRESRYEIDAIWHGRTGMTKEQFAVLVELDVARLDELLSGDEEPTEAEVLRLWKATPTPLLPLIDFEEWIRRARNAHR